MMNVTAEEIPSNYTLDLDCSVYTETSDEWIDFWNFWVGGVFQSFVAIPGFIGKIFNTLISSYRVKNTADCIFD